MLETGVQKPKQSAVACLCCFTVILAFVLALVIPASREVLLVLEKISLGAIISQTSWGWYIGFVILRTRPFFRIPAHTVTYTLPPRYYPDMIIYVDFGRIPAARGPGFTLQFLSTTTGRLRDFRFNPLRGFVFGAGSLAGKFHAFISASMLAACYACGFFALDAAKIPDCRAARTFGTADLRSERGL
jgi:hypothetical protein